MYAFVFLSCISTQPCYGVGAQLDVADAYCREDPDVTDMVHGDVCTLVCHESGKAPVVPELLCDDGTVIGLTGLACETVYVPDTRPDNAGLVDGAVTGGELRTACLRASELECEAKLGGTAIMVSYPDLTSQQCDALFDECQGYNDAFSWSEFTPTSTTETLNADGSGSGEVELGTCNLGCYLDPAGGETASDSYVSPTPAPAQTSAFDSAANSATHDGTPCELYGPACIAVTGSCNAGDNGDFYLNPACATGMPQWTPLDLSRRIRFQDEHTLSQSGKWIMEKDVSTSSDEYGTLVARQMDSFDLEPFYGTTDWTVYCEQYVGFQEYEYLVMSVPLTLAECSCTSEGDCSSNGVAVGSKDFGPNCYCDCNEGWGGDNCSVPLCQAPLIQYALVPPCAEGEWIPAGGPCTPVCVPGYAPNEEVFTCADDGSTLMPSLFECQVVMEDIGSVAQDSVNQVPTPAPYICSSADCSYRGTTTGYIYPETGLCQCICNTGWTGDRCSLRVANCPAPLSTDIANSYTFPCEEGLTITTACTAQCMDGYWPLPMELYCTGTVLEPATFKCYGGTDVEEQWCTVMQYITIGTTVVCLLMLCAICAMRWTAVGRPAPKIMFLGEMPVRVGLDEDGAFHVITSETAPPENKLQGHLLHTQTNLTLAYQAGLDDAAQSMASLHSLAEGTVKEQPQNPGAMLGDDLQVDPRMPTLRELGMVKAGLDPDHNAPASPLLDGGSWAEHALGDPNAQDAGATDAFDANGDPVPLQELDEPLDDVGFDPAWQRRMSELERESLERQRQREARLLEEEIASKAASVAAAEAMLNETEAERDDIEWAIRDACRRGDPGALTKAVDRGRRVLKYLENCPPAPLSQLSRVMLIAEGRLEAYNAQQVRKQAKFAARDRIARGEAPDWTMTVQELWDRVEQLDLGGVRAGLLAKLSVMDRATDRSTILHRACRDACKAGDDTETRSTIIKELMAADAMPNIRDMVDRTPLDLALREGGAGAADMPVVAMLRELGFVTFDEWRAEALAQADAERNHSAAPEMISKRAYDKITAQKDVKKPKRDHTAERLATLRAPGLPRN